MRKVLFVFMICFGSITFHSQAFALDCDEVKSLGELEAQEAVINTLEAKKRYREERYSGTYNMEENGRLLKESAAGWATIYNAFCKD